MRKTTKTQTTSVDPAPTPKPLRNTLHTQEWSVNRRGMEGGEKLSEPGHKLTITIQLKQNEGEKKPSYNRTKIH